MDVVSKTSREIHNCMMNSEYNEMNSYDKNVNYDSTGFSSECVYSQNQTENKIEGEELCL